MSLLLDALKRAEQEKQLSRGTEPTREPVMAPAAANAPSASGLELQPLAPAPGGAPRSESAAHAAQAVFQAKQAQAAEDRHGRGMIWVTIGIVVIVASAAAVYVWTQIKVLTPPLPAPYKTVRPPPAPIPQPASAAPHTDLPLPRFDDARSPSLSPASAAPTTAPATPAPRPGSRNEALVSELLSERAAPTTPAAPPPVRLARTAEAPRIPSDVSGGYQALRAGDLETARRRYQAALAADSRNLDALLGMATVEARSGNRPAAAGHYRRVLEADPRNATALAALASLSDFTQTGSVEPQLLQDIGRAPGNAALHFALGNLYAAQSRWNDAQAAYFEAHRLEPASADIAYNLAVALDQLGKSKLAAGFYRRALEAARGQTAQFDPAAATRRAAELEAGASR